MAMLAEVGHLQEGTEQLVRHTTEPRTLPAASLQVTSYPTFERVSPSSRSSRMSLRAPARRFVLAVIPPLGGYCDLLVKNARAFVLTWYII